MANRCDADLLAQVPLFSELSRAERQYPALAVKLLGVLSAWLRAAERSLVS